ncbi:MAG: sulfurtransferase TusA [Halioglobus sp.]|nr:sulfurtransferase TusA [Halioglobus sp.]
MRPTPDHVLDATGLICPEPVMLLHSRVRDIEKGDVLHVIATDPSTQRDIPKFCTFLGHELLAHDKVGEEFHFLLRKQEAPG